MSFGVKPFPVSPIYSSNPSPDDKLVASNPFEALLPEERLRTLKKLPQKDQHVFMGRVVDSIFKDQAYQSLVSKAANDEFSKMAQPGSSDIRDMVGQMVDEALRARGK